MLGIDRKGLIVLALLLLLGAAVFSYLVLLSPYLKPGLPRVAVPGGWKEVRDQELGVSFQVPEEYQVSGATGDGGLRVSFDGSTQVILLWCDRQEAADRGLWADHQPLQQVELGGRPASYYLYTHVDVLFGLRTHAYVLPFRGKWLALEFRTRRVSMLEDLGILKAEETPLGDTEQQILHSFRFDP